MFGKVYKSRYEKVVPFDINLRRFSLKKWLIHNVKLLFVVTSDHRRWMLIQVSADCLRSYHLRQMSIPGVKTARYLRIRPVADVSNPALLQAIVSKSDFLAVWLLSGAANTEFPEASGRSGTSAVCTVALWLCSSDMCFFFFIIKSPFNYARNSHFVRMKCFHFIFRREREKS